MTNPSLPHCIDRLQARQPLAALICLCLCGCALGPNFHSPTFNHLDRWTQNANSQSQSIDPSDGSRREQSIGQHRSANTPNWWTLYEDLLLEKVVQIALVDNLDLASARLRVEQSRAIRTIERSALFPSLGGTLSYARRDSTSLANRRIDGIEVAESNFSPDLFRSGLDLSWELDFFGRNRRLAEAAYAELISAEESERFTKLRIVSEVISRYLSWRGLQARVSVAEASANRLGRSAQVIRQRLAVGFANLRDLSNVQARLASTQAALSSIRQQEQEEKISLAILLGLTPAELNQVVLPLEPTIKVASPDAEPTLDRLPRANLEIPELMPSELLRRRPDIRAAEASLHAATARIGVATADLFPRFSLSSFLGADGTRFDALGYWDRYLFNYGASVSAPLFQGGALFANLKLREIERDVAFVDYRQVVLNAMREVESALVGLAQEAARAGHLEIAVKESQRAAELSRQLYIDGLGEYSDFLESERDRFMNEEALIAANINRQQNVILLLRALGGDWFEYGTEKPKIVSSERLLTETAPVENDLNT